MPFSRWLGYVSMHLSPKAFSLEYLQLEYRKVLNVFHDFGAQKQTLIHHSSQRTNTTSSQHIIDLDFENNPPLVRIKLSSNVSLLLLS